MKTEKKAIVLISPRKVVERDNNFGIPHLVVLAGYLEKELNIRVELLDLNYENKDGREIIKRLRSHGPFHCIGISCYSSFDYLSVMQLGALVKSCFPDVPLIAGGYHPSAVPQDFVDGDTPFDAVVAGEGEQAFKELVSGLIDGKGVDQEVYRSTAVTRLDSLPRYRWELLDRYRSIPKYLDAKVQIYLSRGCPFRCNFCMETCKANGGWRAYSTDRAIDELRRLGSYVKMKNAVVHIADPLFGHNASWRREFLTKIIRGGIRPRLFWALMRVDTLSEQDVYLLSEAGFAVGFGLESGVAGMLARMNKTADPQAFLAGIMRFEENSRQYGLHWAANLIVGYPGETYSSMEETERFIRHLFCANDHSFGWLSVDPFRLYPGSAVYNAMDQSNAAGTKFYKPAWWHEERNRAFYAEYIDPSSELTYEQRVEFMYSMYAPLIETIRSRFVVREKDPQDFYTNSISRQVRLIQEDVRDRFLLLSQKDKAARSVTRPPS